MAQAEEAGAWAAWKKAAPALSPQAVIRLVGDARLRGRGGAGYPAADKWRAAAAVEGHARYVIANGFEADPGAQVDRLLMEQDPHAVVEGLVLAAYAIGATRGYIAVHERMAEARGRLSAAVRAGEEAGYIGTNALEAALTSTSKSWPCRAGWSSVRRRRSYALSRTSARSPTSGRPTRWTMACGAGRPS